MTASRNPTPPTRPPSSSPAGRSISAPRRPRREHHQRQWHWQPGPEHERQPRLGRRHLLHNQRRAAGAVQPLRHRLRRLQRRRPGRLRRAGDRGGHDHARRNRLPWQPRPLDPYDRRRRRLHLPRPAAGLVHDHRDPAGRLHAGNQLRRHRERGPDRTVVDQFDVATRGGPGRPELQLRRAAGVDRLHPAWPDGRHWLLEQQEWPGADQSAQRRRPAPSSATGWPRPSPTCSAPLRG